MLGYRGIAKIQEFGKAPDRALSIDQLTEDEKPVAIGQGFQEIARAIGGGFHDVNIHFHTCVYTMICIYSQDQREFARRLAQPIAGMKEVKTAP
jgi:hypothetical protein